MRGSSDASANAGRRPGDREVRALVKKAILALAFALRAITRAVERKNREIATARPSNVVSFRGRHGRR
jgi:hypothetical protein